MSPRHNTGRVRIGWAYVPRPMRIEGDAIVIQKALIGAGTQSNDRADWITTIGVLATVAILIIWRLL